MRKKKSTWGKQFALAALFAGAAVLVAFLPSPRREENLQPEVVPEVAPTVLPRVFAVMVENSAEAWPLSGVEEAFLVVEAPVEAAIPRFIAFFAEGQTTEKIGPVRSARPYYLDWAAEFGAVYAHVGGSPAALALLDAYGIADLDQFFQSEYFYRANSRFAPHNVYTTMEDLAQSLGEFTLEAPAYGVWQVQDGAASGEEKSLAIDWTSGDTYDVAWTYDAATNRYRREQGGATYFAENVAVVATDIAILDSVGRRSIRTTGEGAALLAQNGRVIVGVWRKENRTDRLRFYDSAGAEMVMNNGTTWIEIVPSIGQATVTE